MVIVFLFFYSFACKLCRFGGRVVGGRGCLLSCGDRIILPSLFSVYTIMYRSALVCAVMYRSALVCERVCVCVCVCVFGGRRGGGGAHAQH